MSQPPREVPSKGPESRKDDGGKGPADQLRPDLREMSAQNPAFSQRAEALVQPGQSQQDKAIVSTAKSQEGESAAARTALAKVTPDSFKSIHDVVSPEHLDTLNKAAQLVKSGEASPEVVKVAERMRSAMEKMEQIAKAMPAAEREQMTKRLNSGIA